MIQTSSIRMLIFALLVAACSPGEDKKPVNELYSDLNQRRADVESLGCTLEPVLDEPGKNVVRCEEVGLDIMADRIPVLLRWAEGLAEASRHPDVSADQKRGYDRLAMLVRDAAEETSSIIVQAQEKVRAEKKKIESFKNDLHLTLQEYQVQLVELGCDLTATVRNYCGDVEVSELRKIFDDMNEYLSRLDIASLNQGGADSNAMDEIRAFMQDIRAISSNLRGHLSFLYSRDAALLTILFDTIEASFGLKVEGRDLNAPISEVYFVLPGNSRTEEKFQELLKFLEMYVSWAEAFFENWQNYREIDSVREMVILKDYEAILLARQLDLSLEELRKVPAPAPLPPSVYY